MTRKWGTTEWHLANGRRVWATNPALVEIHMSDGAVRHYPMELPEGVSVSCVSVDGRRWVEPPSRDWDAVESVKEVDG